VNLHRGTEYQWLPGAPHDLAPGAARAIIAAMLLAAALSLFLASTAAFASEPCGTGSYPFPYTDVASVTDPFCPGIMEAYVTGVSKGTTPTTFSPDDPVIRLQMTTFLERSLDQGLARGSRRAALNQWWTPQNVNAIQAVPVGGLPFGCAADGLSIWASTYGAVSKVQASTGTVQGSWSGAGSSQAVLTATGKIYVTGYTSPGNLYVIDPTQAPGPVTVAAQNLGAFPSAIAFDGTHIWTANVGSHLAGSTVSIITPQAIIPYPVTNVASGFMELAGILYDGAHIWVTDELAGTLLQLDAGGAVLQTITVGAVPKFPAFDGTNIWVPNFAGNSITVVQASTGNVVATIAADANNQLSGPNAASFDGERVLVANELNNSVTVFKAADLSLIGNTSTASFRPLGQVCSDGINFWVTATDLLRF
jgi:DNA-binding beta-propeller fold protein YncE